MAAAVALRKDDSLEHQASTPSRGEVLARYRQLREISKVHNSAMMGFLSKDAIVHQARRLGLGDGKTIVLDSMDELIPAVDLAIHTAPLGRSRAIDRYAGSIKPAPGSDEALVIAAMRNARFAILIVERRHQAAGLIATDVFRNIDIWLVDEGLEASLPDGLVYATRYYTPDGFSMTAGVGVPIDTDVLTAAVEAVPLLMRKSQEEAIADRRFAEAVYRAAIAEGVTENVRYEDPAGMVA